MTTSETRFNVNGLKCGGCVAKATEVVSKLPGYVDARIDLATKSAVVKGSIDPQAVIQALAGVGYTATVQRD